MQGNVPGRRLDARQEATPPLGLRVVGHPRLSLHEAPSLYADDAMSEPQHRRSPGASPEPALEEHDCASAGCYNRSSAINVMPRRMTFIVISSGLDNTAALFAEGLRGSPEFGKTYLRIKAPLGPKRHSGRSTEDRIWRSGRRYDLHD